MCIYVYYLYVYIYIVIYMYMTKNAYMRVTGYALRSTAFVRIAVAANAGHVRHKQCQCTFDTDTNQRSELSINDTV